MTWSARCRTRARFRYRPAAGFRPARATRRRGEGALVRRPSGSGRAPGSAAGGRSPRSNGRGIDDSRRPVSSPDAVPLRPGARLHPRVGTGASDRGGGPPTQARAVILSSVVLTKSAAVVGIPRSNGLKINDLERQLSNSDAIRHARRPGSAPVRGHLGERRRDAGAAGLPDAPPVGPLSGKRAGAWGVSGTERARRPRFAMGDGEPGRCSASPGGPAPSPRRFRCGGRRRKIARPSRFP